MFRESNLDLGEIKKIRRANYERKLAKKGLLEKKFSPHERISEELCKYLYKNHFLKISVEKNLGNALGNFKIQRGIAVAEETVVGRYKEHLDDVILHELGHMVDSKIKKSQEFSRLDGEAIAEMFEFLIKNKGNIIEAEKQARDSYKEGRLGWIESYELKNSDHVDWSKSSQRALEIYNSKIASEISDILGYREDDKEIN